MDVAHLHLMLTHLPIVGALAATLILAYALWRFMPSTRDLALASLVIVALTAVVAYATGGAAEHVVERIGISEASIEPHESSAMLALSGSLVAAGAAIVAWLVRRNARVEKALFSGLLILMILVDAAYARTGFLGGSIRHTEIQPGSASSQSSGANARPGHAELSEGDR
jgi:hypothetical protein